MGKINPAINFDLRAASCSPCGARKIAKSIDRENYRLLERRNVECRGKMRQMMFDTVYVAAKALAGERLRQQIIDPAACQAVFEPSYNEPEMGSLFDQICE